MPDFDPDAFIAATAPKAKAPVRSGKFDPDAYIAATEPDDAPEVTTTGERFLRGGSQGVTAGFADELGAAAQPVTDVYFKLFGAGEKADKGEIYKNLTRAGASQAYITKALAKAERGEFDAEPQAQSYEGARDYERNRNAIAQKESGGEYGAGMLGGGLLSSALVPGGAGASGATRLASSVGQGMATGLGMSNADLLKGEYGQAAADTGIGGLVGGVAHGVAAGLGSVGSWAKGKVNDITAGLAQSAAQKAAAATASARGEAGRAAQDVYRQLEHLREIRASQPALYAQSVASGKLDPGLMSRLEAELFDKSADKLPGAAAMKAEAAKAYRDAISSEAQRAGENFDKSASLDEAKRLVMTPLKRYAIRAGLGGAAGYALGDREGHGGLGAAVGAGAGVGLGPLIPTMQRAIMRPEVRRAAWSGVSKVFGPSAVDTAAQGAESSVVPEVADYMRGKYPDLAGAVADKKPSPHEKLTSALVKNPANFGPYRTRLVGAAARGPEALARESMTLAQSDPNYNAMLATLGLSGQGR